MKTEHGSYASYRSGCRCGHCGVAAAERTMRRKRGERMPEHEVFRFIPEVDLSEFDPTEARRAITAQICPFCERGPFTVVVSHVSKSHGVDRLALRDWLFVSTGTSLSAPEYQRRRSEFMADLIRTGKLTPGSGRSSRPGRPTKIAVHTRTEALQKAQQGWVNKSIQRYDYLRSLWDAMGQSVQRVAAIEGFSPRYTSQLLKRAGVDVPNQKKVAHELLRRETNHGTLRMYTTFRCRCSDCRRANTAQKKEDRERRKARDDS